MHPRIYKPTLIALVLVLAALVAVPGATAKAPVKSYVLHGKKCKKGYQKRNRPRGKKVCVKRPVRPVAKPAPYTLQAHLRPSPKRDPLNPFRVTYGYSASASRTSGAVARASSGEEPLPEGVLALYSDGKLECAVNVGGSNAASECPVNYSTLGAHRVTTIYTSGGVSATETVIEQIDPLPTSTSLRVGYEELPVSEAADGSSGWLRIGTLHVQATASTSGAVKLSCGLASECIEPASGPLGGGVQLNASGAVDIPVYLRENAMSAWEIKVDSDLSTGVVGPSWLPPSEFEQGSHNFRAVLTPPSGYLGSEATAPIQFRPEVRPG